MRWLLAVLMMVGAAHAQSVPTISVLLESGAEESVALQKHSFFYAESDLGETVTMVKLQHIRPESIEHQFTVQGAIGLEGPWFDLEGVTVDSIWQAVVTQNNDGVFTIPIWNPEHAKSLLGDNATVKLMFNVEQVKAAVRHEKPSADERSVWLEAAENCDKENGSCYTYRGRDQFRFIGEDGQRYQLTLKHLGGC